MKWLKNSPVGTFVLPSILVALAASCANSPTRSDSGVEATIVQTIGQLDFSLEIRLTNREAHPVWIADCHGVQRRHGTFWVDDVRLGVACQSTPPVLLDGNSSITRFVVLRRSALGEDLAGERFRVVFHVRLSDGWAGSEGFYVATRTFSLD